MGGGIFLLLWDWRLVVFMEWAADGLKQGSYVEATSGGATLTTSTNWVQKTTVSAGLGKWICMFSVEISCNSGPNAEGQFVVEGTERSFIKTPDGTSQSSDKWLTFTGFFIVTVAGGLAQLQLKLRSSDGTSTAYMRRAKIFALRLEG